MVAQRNVKTGVETDRVTLFGRSLAYRLYGQPAPGPAAAPSAPVKR